MNRILVRYMNDSEIQS